MSGQAKKILCAVSHANQDPWIDIWKHGQTLTWQKWKDTENFTIINFFGRKPSLFTRTFDRIHEKIRWSNKYFAKSLMLIENALLWPLIFLEPKLQRDFEFIGEHLTYKVDFIDSFLTYRWKILSLIQYFLEETEYDFLYVTSSSSYIRPKVLLRFSSTLPDSGIYLGPLPYEGADFISGSSRLISRDVAQLLWDHRRKFRFALIEDKAMANLLLRLDVHPRFLGLVNLTSVEEAEALQVEEFQGIYHFRLKSLVNGARIDVDVMKALHSKFKDEFISA
jgi:hypothetical protein